MAAFRLLHNLPECREWGRHQTDASPRQDTSGGGVGRRLSAFGLIHG